MWCTELKFNIKQQLFLLIYITVKSENMDDIADIVNVNFYMFFAALSIRKHVHQIGGFLT